MKRMTAGDRCTAGIWRQVFCLAAVTGFAHAATLPYRFVADFRELCA